MPIDTEQWRAHTGLFCASRVLLRPPRCKQPQPKVQADTLSLNMKFSVAVLLVTLRTGISYASRILQLLCLIACHASWLLSSIVRLSCRRLRGVSVLLALCLVVVQMLLIMSGDVEENPGPPKIQTTSLGVSDLSCVWDELQDVSHSWFWLGLELNLNTATLKCVRGQHPDPSTALHEMLLLWLKKVDPPPTWEGLACALENRTVGEPRLAEQLRTKYCKTEGPAGGSVGQTVAATEEEQPSHLSWHIRRLRPAASRSYIPRPMARKGATSLGMSDLSCVWDELLDVSHSWYELGLKLQLSVEALKRVRDQYPGPSTALREMLLLWLKKVDPPPTWEGLACALESRTVEEPWLAEPWLAEQLRTKYCKTEGATGGSVGQTVAATEEEQPSHPSRRVPKLLPAASKSYIPRLKARKGATSLGSSDLGCVWEELLDASYKWFDIGLQLRLSVSVLEQIRHQYPGPSTALREMLLHWLKKVYMPPTWEGLACALESRTVGEPRLAEQLRTKYCKTEGAADPQRNPLLIRTRTPILHPLIYGPVPSSPAHTPVDQYASYLRSVYTSRKLPTHSKWPPTATKKYIHLAVVKKERVSKQQADEFTKSTLHGDIDDICKKKQAVNFTQIGKMEDGTPAKLILVEGAPGIGKTTFSWKICQKWAKGKILQEYGLVVLLRLRDQRVQEIKYVADLFYHPDRELQNSVAKEIQHHHGNSVLLLFDGYDELPRKLQTQQSIFLDILHKNFLPHATILITSRPTATKFLHSQFRRQRLQHIEILGFTRDDIVSYVCDAMEDEQVRRDFLQYLKCYPHIGKLMYVPLNAVIVTEVYKSSQQSPEQFIPITMTGLYTALTRSLLLRYLLSHSEYGQQEWTLKTFSDLPQNLYGQFNRICEVALKGMIEDKFVHNDLPHDFNTLDLMQSVPELYVKQWASISYNFFHLTLQEFLAAVSISQKPIEEQIHFIKGSISGFDRTKSTPIASDTTSLDLSILPLPEPHQHQHLIPIVPSPTHLMQSPLHLPTPHGRPDHPYLLPPFRQTTFHTEMELDDTDTMDSMEPDDTDTMDSMELDDTDTVDSAARFQNVLRFVAGLTGYKNIPPDSLMPVVLEWHEEFAASISLNSLHWLFEAKCINLYSDLVRNFTSLQYSSSRTTMTPSDCFVLGYALSHITFAGHWKIKMSQCHVDDECLEMLAGGVNFMSSTGLTGVRMTKLVMFGNNITERGTATLAEILKGNAMLQQLDVSHNLIGDGGATTLAEMLKENRTLEKLDVSNNSIGDGGATALAEVLMVNTTLQKLNVRFNSIGDGGATTLAHSLKMNMTLQQLNVSNNSIGNGGATALAGMLRVNQTLQQLNVSFNSIGNEGATALAQKLMVNRTLQQLIISNNFISEGGATALTEVMKQNKTVSITK